MRVIGIDLSLTGTGISDGSETWEIGEVGHLTDSLMQRRDRRHRLVSQVMTLVGKADLVLLEAPAPHSSTGRIWDRAGAWWSVVDSVAALGMPVVEVPLSSLKVYATGKGNAGKPQMLEAAIRRLPDVVHKASDNRVDALWLAAIGLDHHGLPLCDMPVTHRKALDNVRWP